MDEKVKDFYERLFQFLDQETIKEIGLLDWELSQVQKFPEWQAEPTRIVFFLTIKKNEKIDGARN